MFIEIHELERRPVNFDEEFTPGTIDFGEDVQQRTPLKSDGRADLVEEHHGKHKVLKDIRLQGALATTLEFPCARCLEPVVLPVNRKFDLLYRPQGSDAGKEELSVTGVEAEIGYYQGEGLLLEDVLRDVAGFQNFRRSDARSANPTSQGATLRALRTAALRFRSNYRFAAVRRA